MNFIMNTFQLVGCLILSVGYIPQIRKVIKTKSMKDFDFSYLLALVVGVACMEVYAVYNVMKGVATMFFITNTITFLLAVAMLVLYMIFEENNKWKH